MSAGARARAVEIGHALGWSFAPLRGKRPTRRAWQSALRETRAEALVWAREGNLGLRTGKSSGVFVLDRDTTKGACPLELPRTV